MTRQLSSKVEHCPRCKKLKSKTGTCKSCGYGKVALAIPSFTIKGLDIKAVTSIKINDIIFTRK